VAQLDDRYKIMMMMMMINIIVSLHGLICVRNLDARCFSLKWIIYMNVRPQIKKGGTNL